MLRSYILPHPSLALSPGSPRLPFPVQLNTEPRIGWSRCLGRADIFETLTPRCARKSFNRGLCVFLLHCWKQNKFHSTSLQLLLPLVQQHFMEIHSILAATQCCHLIHPSIFLTRVIPKWCCWAWGGDTCWPGCQSITVVILNFNSLYFLHCGTTLALGAICKDIKVTTTTVRILSRTGDHIIDYGSLSAPHVEQTVSLK